VLINDFLASGNIADLMPKDEKDNCSNAIRGEVKQAGLQEKRHTAVSDRGADKQTEAQTRYRLSLAIGRRGSGRKQTEEQARYRLSSTHLEILAYKTRHRRAFGRPSGGDQKKDLCIFFVRTRACFNAYSQLRVAQLRLQGGMGGGGGEGWGAGSIIPTGGVMQFKFSHFYIVLVQYLGAVPAMLHDVGDQVYVHFMQYFGARDLCKVSQVCKQLKLQSQCNLLWHNLCLEEFWDCCYTGGPQLSLA
jgi:hypothetical protein